MQNQGPVTRPRTTGVLRIGFVPLLDAAPLIAAFERGYFADEGLDVQLSRQIGWGNVRDKLSFGQLDASHALLGMPLASHLKWAWYVEPLVSLMTLSTGGNAITLSGRLADRGVTYAAALKQWLAGGRREDAPLLGHVSTCSTHHYLLRRWLREGGIDPDKDVRLCVVPPPQMASQLSGGTLDGFCVGEPWNTLAVKTARGRIIQRTTAIIPDHPEKVLAVTGRWLAQNPEAAERLVRACVRGCQFCHAPTNRNDVARMLSQRIYLGLSEDLIRTSLAFTSQDDGLSGLFPSPPHMAWLLEEMQIAGDAPSDMDIRGAVEACCHTETYRAVAASLGLPCADVDWAETSRTPDRQPPHPRILRRSPCVTTT